MYILTEQQQQILTNLPQFGDLGDYEQELVIKHFFGWKGEFYKSKNDLLIRCKKCLNASLVDQSEKGMIEHYLAHITDNMSRGRNLNLNFR